MNVPADTVTVPMRVPPPHRRLLLLSAAMLGVVAACSPGSVAPEQSPDTAAQQDVPTATAPSPSPTPSPSPSPSPPAIPAPYEPEANEVYPNAKRLAGRVAQLLTTYEQGTTVEEVVAGVAPDAAYVEELTEAAAPLVRAGVWSRGSVVYPQLGGVLSDRVSVMVVTRQELGTGSEVTDVVTRTLDVRLRLDGEEWVLDRVASIGGAPVDGDVELPAVAQEVLTDDRISLPDSARWDIQRGEVDPALLTLMRDLAARVPYEVVVLSSGHPFEVFGTEVQSNHTKGRAVDIHLLDRDLVIDQQDEGSPAHEVVQWLYDRPEVSEVGSPWALDGYGGRSFTDVVHADHIHVGVRAGG